MDDVTDCREYISEIAKLKCDNAKLELELSIAKGEIQVGQIQILVDNIRHKCEANDDLELFVIQMAMNVEIVKLKGEVNTIRFILPILLNIIILFINNKGLEGNVNKLIDFTEFFNMMLLVAPENVTKKTIEAKDKIIRILDNANNNVQNIKETFNRIIPIFVIWVERTIGYSRYSAIYLTVFLLIIYYIVTGQPIAKKDGPIALSNSTAIGMINAQQKNNLRTPPVIDMIKTSKKNNSRNSTSKRKKSISSVVSSEIYKIAEDNIDTYMLDSLHDILIGNDKDIKYKIGEFLIDLNNKIDRNIKTIETEIANEIENERNKRKQSSKKGHEPLQISDKLKNIISNIQETIKNKRKGKEVVNRAILENKVHLLKNSGGKCKKYNKKKYNYDIPIHSK